MASRVIDTEQGSLRFEGSEDMSRLPLGDRAKGMIRKSSRKKNRRRTCLKSISRQKIKRAFPIRHRGKVFLQNVFLALKGKLNL